MPGPGASARAATATHVGYPHFHPCHQVFTYGVGEEAGRDGVALVAGATRGAGRAIAIEMARTGFFVYATGRSSRVSNLSEIGRLETIEETVT